MLYIMQELKDKYIDPFAAAEIAKLTKEEYHAYIDSLNSYRDYNNTLDYAKKEGKIEGKIEEKIETALKMLGDGVSFENICKYTELSKEQIEQLINETKKN